MEIYSRYPFCDIDELFPHCSASIDRAGTGPGNRRIEKSDGADSTNFVSKIAKIRFDCFRMCRINGSFYVFYEADYNSNVEID